MNGTKLIGRSVAPSSKKQSLLISTQKIKPFQVLVGIGQSREDGLKEVENNSQPEDCISSGISKAGRRKQPLLIATQRIVPVAAHGDCKREFLHGSSYTGKLFVVS